ncbi:EAL domain-containing protein [Marinospirillum sp. MEB164]|uniref:EAL domain-containing protein n=1 Tax=Marinospirillum alkalitolerans TaxID=3123374 RepID=A0ABW8PXI3_9GAMM
MSWLHTSRHTLLLTLGYLLTFWCALSLNAALPAFFFSVWLPSGLALAGVLHFGYRALYGIALGALLAHFSLALLTPAPLLEWPNLISALLLSATATGQAAAGRWLILRLQAHPLKTSEKGSLIRFFLWPVLSLAAIHSLMDSLILAHLFGDPQLNPLIFWFGYWAGEVLGLALLTPLLLIALHWRSQTQPSRHLQSTLYQLGGSLAFILLLHQLLLVQFTQQAQERFNQDVALLDTQLHRLFQQNLADLSQLERSFTRHSSALTPSLFRELTLPILASNPSVLAYSWDPLVHQQEQAAFEQLTRALLGQEDFAIYGAALDERDPLIVVQFVEPRATNQEALGFNLMSLDDRRDWILLAQSSGRPVNTDILRLTQAPDEPGFLILQPVYTTQSTQDQQSPLEGQKSLVGFMAGVFTVNRMIEAALSASQLQALNLQAYQNRATAAFYQWQDSQGGLDRLPLSSSQRFSTQFALQLGDQQWQLHIQSTPEYLALQAQQHLLLFHALLCLSAFLACGLALHRYQREGELATRVQQQTQKLSFQAHHDALTGLPNRISLENDIQRQLSQPCPHLALIFIDLDRFKLINDSLGHLTGDHLLIELSARWQQETQQHFAHSASEVTFYRLGGDEFALLLSAPALQQCRTEAEQLSLRLLELSRHPMQIDGLVLQTSISLGLAWTPDHGLDFNSLVRNADTALHQAKRLGKNTYQIYQQAQTEQMLRDFELEQELRLALNTQQIQLHYQPQYHLTTRELCGLEALVRWQHPVRGMIRPDHFIPLAEETQMIIPLGWQVLDQACRQTAQWLEEGYQVPCVAVNISPLQLLQADFIEQLNLLVDSYGLHRQRLELEITENLLQQNPDFAFQQLKSLRLAGYRLALDDFGTGYSSLNRLKLMPLDRIKIDKSFIRDIGKNTKDDAIILSIINLGHSLGVEVLAEGVETAQQDRFLRHHGCDTMQGYLLGRPVAQPELQRRTG